MCQFRCYTLTISTNVYDMYGIVCVLKVINYWLID